MATILTKKPRMAIFDLTDCEGCELVFLELREKLVKLLGQVEIANWRIAGDNRHIGPYDIAFVEGSVITESDIEAVKLIRASSSLVISLGSCAELGGIQAIYDTKKWQDGIKKVYGPEYKTKSKPPKPISYYIDVDYHLPGCPINVNELEQFLTSIILLKKPTPASWPVCLECKAKENSCLLLEGQPCLGPVTKGGCEAVCPERGLRCWGCFGALKGGNQKALKNFFEKKFGKERTKQLLEIFYSQQDEFKELYLGAKVEISSDKPKKKVNL